MTKQSSLALVGCGLMAQAYAKVLSGQQREFDVIGRGADSAAKFHDATGLDVTTGGVEAYVDQHGVAPDTAVVAVNLMMLADVSMQLLNAGTRRLLIEKPGALDRAGLRQIERAAANAGAEVFIAYNRRFFASTLAAERIIADDGGLTSLQFEFTEWIHRIGIGVRPVEEYSSLLVTNSSHVIDLAFHLGGRPVDWQAWTGGTLDWHSPGSRFCGAGLTDRGAMFSYLANWQAPGRWSVELMTRKHRLHLRPMETLGVQEIGSVDIKPMALDDHLDREFKPGIYRQTTAFLDGTESNRLPTLAEHAQFWDAVLTKVAGGPSVAVRHAA